MTHKTFFAKVVGNSLFILPSLSTKAVNIELMLMRGRSIADIMAIEHISKGIVLSVLSQSNYQIKPKQSHYHHLESDEFWTYVGKKTK